MMSIPVFGNNPRGVQTEADYSGLDQGQQVEALKAEIFKARKKLQESEVRLAELQKKADEYMSKERQIAEIMITAQINAQRTEAQARACAEVMLQETEDELRLKQQELELLKMRAQLFKEDILSRLDHYKTSVEKITDDSEDASFMPTLVAREKKGDHKLIG